MSLSKQVDLANVSRLLNSIEEVEQYIITDMEGKIHSASSSDYHENTVNSCIYLWVIGSQFGNKFNLGEPANLVYNQKARKMFIQKFNDYLIILSLIDMTKFTGFKKKFYERLSREI